MVVLVKLVIAHSACCAAYRGTVILGTCARLFGAGTLLRPVTEASVFDWLRIYSGHALRSSFAWQAINAGS